MNEIKIVVGDITKLKVDAIVNAANKTLREVEALMGPYIVQQDQTS